MSEGKQKLSVTDRLRLIQTLNALPATQFDELVFALKPTAGNLPGETAPQGTRSKALLDWVESPIGPGISELEQILQVIIEARSESLESSNPQTQQIEALREIIQTLKESQAPKYDLRGAYFSGGFAETVQSDQIGGTQVNFLNQQPIPHRIRAVSSSPDLQIVRAKLLRRLKDDINIRLENSLHNLVKIDLQMEDQRQQVGRTKKLELIPEDPIDESAPPGTARSVVNRVFQPLGRESPGKELDSAQSLLPLLESSDVQNRLLILGEPGAGKTTELVALTYDLLQRAEQDALAPIPIIFELSSWQEGNSIEQWLVEQLKRIYRLKEGISKQWLEDEQIFPLLDGLDELGSRLQQKCITAINQFLQTHTYTYATVCCRREAYEMGQTKLSQLRGAVYLRPLTDQQIQDYLKDLNRFRCWENIKDNPELLNLACQPLFLAMIVVSYQGDPVGNISDLFNAYIKQQLEDPSTQEIYPPGKLPSQQKTFHYLRWLAKQMERVGLTEYLIEEMQPSWLSSTGQDSYRKFFSPSFGIPIEQNKGLNFLIRLPLYQDKLDSAINVSEGIVWSTRKALSKRLFKKLIVFFAITMILIFFMLIRGVPMINLLIFSPIFYSILGLNNELSKGLVSLTFEEKSYPNQGIRKSLYNSLVIGSSIGLIVEIGLMLAFGLSFGLIVGLNNDLEASLIVGLNTGLLFGLTIGPIIALSFALSFALNAGLTAVVRHYVMRRLFVQEGNFPWDCVRFLEYAAKLRFIQRVGGRYRFMHDLLREHFAVGELPSYPSPSDPKILR